MAQPIQKPKGTRDFLPEDLELWQEVEAAFHEIAGRYGYGLIRTPMFEDVDLFARGIGDGTDVVSKELYILKTGGERYALRPEQTASVVRAYLENGLHKSAPFSKFYYLGAQFRHERQQKNRYRQLYQAGIEALGSGDPLLDAEIIELGVKFLEGLGLTGLTVRLNTLGDSASLERYRAALRQALEPRRAELGQDDQVRLERNVLRVLDSKDAKIKELLPSLPKITEFLSENDQAHYREVKKALEIREVAFDEDPWLVRGFDYYTGPVWEYFYKSFGQQDAIGAGGRYDDLVETLGGPPTPCVGLSMGLDRIVNAVAEKRGLKLGARRGKATEVDVYVINDGWPDSADVARVVGFLRDAGLTVDTDYLGKSVKAQESIAKKRKGTLAVELRYDGSHYWTTFIDLTNWKRIGDPFPKKRDPLALIRETIQYARQLDAGDSDITTFKHLSEEVRTVIQKFEDKLPKEKAHA